MIGGKPTSTDKLRISRVEVYWHTVKYRTVALYVIVITTIVLAATYLVFPEGSSNVLRRISETVASHEGGVATPSARQARFVNLDGKVQVKKVNSVEWTNADYQVTLDKGDLIQTGPEGVARIQFADGTQYWVKGDTLVTVEENNVAQDRATAVSVHLSTGQVDLQTGTWEMPDSKAGVSFENAFASLRANSRAAVRSDPTTNEEEITVSAGAAELSRGTEHQDIGQGERATFRPGGQIERSQVLAPPQLVEPVNLQPVIVADPKHDPIRFSWKPAATAKQYEFQVSTTGMFNHVLMERKVAANELDLTGLPPGDYFWRVRAIDEKGNASEPSDPFKFILVVQGKEEKMLLEVDDTELQGNVVEIVGRTDPGAALIINGEQVVNIQSDGRFRYFTQPMARGSHEIVIIGQNRRGGTNTKRVTVVIP